MCLCTMLLKYALSIPPTFKKAANPVAFSAGTWYNNNNKNPGKIAETSRGENMKHKPLPIGVEDFKRLVDNGYYFG